MCARKLYNCKLESHACSKILKITLMGLDKITSNNSFTF